MFQAPRYHRFTPIEIKDVQAYSSIHEKETIMSVKIFIKRNVAESNIIELTILLKKLRSLTINQPGYISGETLRRVDKADECMVISTWRSIEDWNSWVKNEKRKVIQGEIDQLLGKSTEYDVYED